MWLLEKINKPLARMTREKLSKVIKGKNSLKLLKSETKGILWWSGG